MCCRLEGRFDAMESYDEGRYCRKSEDEDEEVGDTALGIPCCWWWWLAMEMIAVL
jgi:hypothetical protein